MDVNIFIKDSPTKFTDRDKELRRVMSVTSLLIPPSSNGLYLIKKTSSGDDDFIDTSAADESPFSTQTRHLQRSLREQILPRQFIMIALFSLVANLTQSFLYLRNTKRENYIL